MLILISILILWVLTMAGACIFLAINKRPSPIGYCSICKARFYEPHAAHYTNVHKDRWQNIVIKEKTNVE